jgi:hypothetical protein
MITERMYVSCGMTGPEGSEVTRDDGVIFDDEELGMIYKISVFVPVCTSCANLALC